MDDITRVSNLLSKGIWTNQDIADYAGCSLTTASKIRQEAIKLGGACKIFPQKVRSEKVLEALGLDYKTEIQNINLLRGGKDDNSIRS